MTKKKRGRPKKEKKILTPEEEAERKRLTNKKQRDKYRNEVQLNPYKVRAYTKYEKARMKKKKELTCE